MAWQPSEQPSHRRHAAASAQQGAATRAGVDLRALAATGAEVHAAIAQLEAHIADDLSLTIAHVATTELARLAAVVGDGTGAEREAVAARAETHLSRLDDLLRLSTSRAAERCTALVDRLAMTAEHTDDVAPSQQLVREALSLRARFRRVAGT